MYECILLANCRVERHSPELIDYATIQKTPERSWSRSEASAVRHLANLRLSAWAAPLMFQRISPTNVTDRFGSESALSMVSVVLRKNHRHY
jgi:hypothetical protein